jgi:queuine tRNA-ribosyltransferase
MRWKRPIITDSGGFQVMSLAKLRKITDAGVTFQSHLDGSSHMLTPERAVEIQCLLGSDIQMQLDECIALPATREATRAAVDRSLAWAERCKRGFAREVEEGTAGPGQALFGIVQGGVDAELRARSADGLVAMDFPGYAVGGLAVGETQQAMLETLELRHVRLRDPDPLGPPRPRLHLGRQGQPQERAACRRPEPPRSGQQLSGRA